MEWYVIAALLITLIPVLEHRVAIPFIAFFGGDQFFLYVTEIVTLNILVGLVMFYVLGIFGTLMYSNRVTKSIYLFWHKKVIKRASWYVQRYGLFSLLCFHALPLPTGGVYVGSIFAKFLGYRFKDYFAGTVFGILLSATFVTVGTWVVFKLFLW